MSGIPRAIESERAVLGSVLYDPALYARVRNAVSNDEWYVEQHRTIWSAMCELAEQAALDPIALHARLLEDKAALDALVSIVGLAEVASLEWHLTQITDAAAARALVKAGQHLLQLAEMQPDPVALAEDTIAELRLIQRATAVDVSTVSDFHDLVARVFDPADFVVPALLAKRNRIIITAPEGYGKSTLTRQLAACAAAGVHPFKTRGFCRTARSLVIDAENPEEINTVEYQRLFDGLSELGRLPERGMLTIDECGPINLLDSRQAARVVTLVEKIEPELLVIGPVYQLHEENPNDEGPARKVAAVLDRLRAVCGSALVMEAHTPHSDGPQGQLLRPYGASLWKRWPEFGYCLHPTVTPRRNSALSEEEERSLEMRESYFTAWRGNRAARAWPSRLCAGNQLSWAMY